MIIIFGTKNKKSRRSGNIRMFSMSQFIRLRVYKYTAMVYAFLYTCFPNKQKTGIYAMSNLSPNL